MINTKTIKQILKLSSGVVLEDVAEIGVWISSAEGVHFVAGAIYPALLPLFEGTRMGMNSLQPPASFMVMQLPITPSPCWTSKML